MAKGISFLGGLASGIASGLQLRQQMDRSDADKQRQEEERQARLEERAEKKEQKRQMQDALRPVDVQAGAGGALKPDEMDNRDVGLAENQALPNGGLASQGYRVAGRSFGTMAEANQAATQANAPEARNARISQALAQTQGPMAAMQFDAANKQAKAADIQIKEAEQQAASRTFARGAAEAMAKGDWDGFAKFATDNYSDGYTYRATADGKGGATMTRIDKDGKELGSMPFKSREDAIVMAATRADPVKYAEFITSRNDKAQAQANADREFDLRKQSNESDAAYKKRLLDIQERQDSRAAASHRAAMQSEKLPPAVRMQADSLADQMKGVSTALNKAMAENSFDPNSDNAKRLLGQQAELSIRYQQLLTPYSGPGGQGGAPAGLPDASVFNARPAAQAAAPAAAPGPMQQAAAAAPPARPAYTPPPGSPSARHMERQQALRAEQAQREAQLLQAAESAAAAAIQSRDPAQADAAQQLPGFSALPLEQKAAIRQIVFGR